MPDEVTHKLCVDQPRVYQTTSCIDAVFRMLQSQVLGQDITGRTSRFFVGHRPPSRLPSRLPDVTHVTLSPRPSPPFLYCKRSKLEPGTAWERGYRFYTASDQNWSREWPGNEATSLYITRFGSLVPRPFPAPVLIACSIKTEAIKTGGGNGLGTRLEIRNAITKHEVWNRGVKG